MVKNVLIAGFTIAFAFGILLISVFRTTSVKYSFNPLNPSETSTVLGEDDSQINYYLPYAGKVLPDSPLWILKSLRDKLWLAVNTNPTREAELKLLFADKRIRSAVILFEKGNEQEGLATLTKAEKYLEEAYFTDIDNRRAGHDTSDFMIKLANASLKHFELLEYVYNLCSDEAKPVILEYKKIPKKVYEDMRNNLIDRQITPPENPFNWD